MSLINQMLKDLEQRQGTGGPNEPLAGEVRVVRETQGPNYGLMGGLAIAVLAVIGAVWMFMQPKASQAPVVATAPPPVANKPVIVAQVTPPAPAPVPAPAPAPAPAPVAAPPVAAAPVAPPPPPAASPPPAPAPVAAAPVARPAPAAPAPAPVALPLPPPAPAPVAKPAPPPKPPATPVAAAGTVTKNPPKVYVEERPPAAPAPVVEKAPPTTAALAERRPEKTVNSQQQSENQYKQAIALLQQGKGTEARRTLRQSLEASPGNVGARQLLVGLLVEGGDFEEASKLLREGLRLSPEQSTFSMTLARLQLERGDSKGGMLTLEQGLRSAGNDAQYHGFYAALLQGAERHEEAVRHYLVALRSDPGMPSWLVGIGISLQALGKDSDAAEAFQRAKDSGMLSPQLAGFVDQRLGQLRR